MSIDNRKGSDHCPYCHDTGQVVAELRREKVYADPERETEPIEVMGPCQACDLGQWMEFPGPDEKGKPQVGVWGEEGFWRGRKMDVQAEVGSQLSREENAERMAELMKRMAAVG